MILVTGATGRVGYRLMEALADAGADVTAMVRVEARAADLQVEYQDQPAERARELMLASGMPGWEADGYLELFEWVREGGADTVTDTVRQVTGADPRPVQDWLSDARGSFFGRPPDRSPPVF